nr:MAG TPA: hypothetical protein [Caudoviricetes sp.]
MKGPVLSFFSFLSSSRLLQIPVLRNLKVNILECSLLVMVGQLPYCRCMATRKGRERR